MSKLPQKSFDSQLHISRDVHFDVDKYKVGELYVINKTLWNIIDDVKPLLFQKSKIIGLLQNVDDTSLTFRIICIHQDPQYISIYEWNDITLSIDTIIDHRIEIERLLTETEATMYLSECADTIDHAKINRMLGLTSDTSQFPYTLENTKSYQEFDAAYKNDTISNEDCEMESQEDSNIDKNNYTIQFNDKISGYNYYTGPVSFIDKKGNFATYLFKSLQSFKSGYINIDMVKGKNKISLKIKPKDITVEPDFICINIQKSSYIATSIKLRIEDFHEMFDIIRFDQNSNISKISKGWMIYASSN